MGDQVHQELSEFKRRITDKLKGSSDHDLLIRHSVKIDNVCKSVIGLGNKFDKFSDKVDKFSDKVDKRCERRQVEIYDKIDVGSEDKMDRDTFKWLMGFMILIIMAIVSAIGYNQVKIKVHESVYKFNIEQIRNNQESIKELQTIIDLKLSNFIKNKLEKHVLDGTNNNYKIHNHFNE